MNIREWIINIIKPDNTELVTITADDAPAEEVTTTPEPVERINKKKSRKRQKGKPLNKKYISGESDTTTGTIYKIIERNHMHYGKYQYYWYDTKLHKPFHIMRDNPKELLEIQQKWIDCGFDASKWKEIIGTNRGKRHYIYRRGNSYCIRKDNITFGNTPTREQAMFIVKYLIFRNWDIKYKSTNLSGGRNMRGNEYYLAMKAIIQSDNEYRSNGGI